MVSEQDVNEEIAITEREIGFKKEMGRTKPSFLSRLKQNKEQRRKERLERTIEKRLALESRAKIAQATKKEREKIRTLKRETESEFISALRKIAQGKVQGSKDSKGKGKRKSSQGGFFPRRTSQQVQTVATDIFGQPVIPIDPLGTPIPVDFLNEGAPRITSRDAINLSVEDDFPPNPFHDAVFAAPVTPEQALGVPQTKATLTGNKGRERDVLGIRPDIRSREAIFGTRRQKKIIGGL